MGGDEAIHCACGTRLHAFYIDPLIIVFTHTNYIRSRQGDHSGGSSTGKITLILLLVRCVFFKQDAVVGGSLPRCGVVSWKFIGEVTRLSGIIHSWVESSCMNFYLFGNPELSTFSSYYDIFRVSICNIAPLTQQLKVPLNFECGCYLHCSFSAVTVM